MIGFDAETHLIARGRLVPRMVCLSLAGERSVPPWVDDAACNWRGYVEVDGRSWWAVLDREGAEGPADVAIVGDEASVAKQILALADAGVTDFAAAEFAQSADEVRRTRDALRSLL